MIYLLIAIVIISLIINSFFLKNGFRDVHYDMEIEKTFVEIGEDVTVRSIIENRKYLPIPYIEIKESFPHFVGNRLHNMTLLIKARERVIRTHLHKTEKRGQFKDILIELKLGDFLGFYYKNQKLILKKNINVKPKKVALKDQISSAASMQGDISVRRWIIDDPLMIAGVREYNTMDSQKLIHWPSSVRQGRLMVKKFDFTSENSTIVVLNNETVKPCPEKPTVNLIEDSIISCRSICDDLDAKNIEFAFTSNAYNYSSYYERGYSVSSGLGSNHLNSVLEILSVIDYKPDLRYHRLIQRLETKNMIHSSIILVTPRILDEYIDTINNLALKVPKVIVVTHTDENIKELDNNIMIYRGKNND